MRELVGKSLMDLAILPQATVCGFKSKLCCFAILNDAGQFE